MSNAKKKKLLKDFKQQKANLNLHTERGMKMLKDSMQEVGYAGPMVAAADGEIIDGSARHEVAANVFGGESEPIIIESDGKKPVIVVRKDIPNAKSKMAKRLATFANRTNEVNLEWNTELLQSILMKDKTLAQGMFDDAELENLLTVAPVEFPRIDENLPIEHKCPKCGYEWSGKPA